MTNPDEPTKEAPCRHFWSNPRSNGSKVCAWCGEIKPVNDSTMSAKQIRKYHSRLWDRMPDDMPH